MEDTPPPPPLTKTHVDLVYTVFYTGEGGNPPINPPYSNFSSQTTWLIQVWLFQSIIPPLCKNNDLMSWATHCRFSWLVILASFLRIWQHHIHTLVSYRGKVFNPVMHYPENRSQFWLQLRISKAISWGNYIYSATHLQMQRCLPARTDLRNAHSTYSYILSNYETIATPLLLVNGSGWPYVHVRRCLRKLTGMLMTCPSLAL